MIAMMLTVVPVTWFPLSAILTLSKHMDCGSYESGSTSTRQNPGSNGLLLCASQEGRAHRPDVLFPYLDNDISSYPYLG
ncbi:hypothetical protein ACIRYZ_24990 [Kitasatospora sp. NPDC101155]|uniref:hypothetical protein n=1 Tax=Kitasatospora sp. NPDC101155 TaxID=3364097 RepID=UPI00381261B8